MLIDFVGAIATGFGLLGLVLLVNRLILRGRFGPWIYPASVALGMVGFTVWAEYTWAQRTVAALPQLELASQSGDPVFYRPWTYVFPHTTRVVTVDLSQTRTHPEQPDLVMTRVVLIGRWQPIRAVGVVYDCATNQRADLVEGVTLNEAGTLEGASWIPLRAEDPVLRTACAAAGEGGEEGIDGRGNGA
ncbi:MAG: hypothetical protein ACK4GT_06395 [Pararhodobacter sp.]